MNNLAGKSVLAIHEFIANLSPEEVETYGSKIVIEQDGYTIIVTRRYKDWHAGINGLSSICWGCGKTVEEAVEQFLKTAHSFTNGKVKYKVG